jgi:hypothetical protein
VYRLAQRLWHLVRHLVTVGVNGRTEEGVDAPGLRAAALHGAESTSDRAGCGAAPAGMDDCQDARLGIDQGQRDAVRHQDGERDPGRHGDEDVGVGDGVVFGERAAAAIVGSDQSRPGAVHLTSEDDVFERDAERSGRPGPVRDHGLGIVTHVQAEVEGVVGSLRRAAVPRRHGDVDPESRCVGPAQHRNG